MKHPAHAAGLPRAFPGVDLHPAAVFLAIVVSLVLLRQVFISPYLLLDVDLGWHIRYGQEILSARALPSSDAWSWTSHGRDYQLTQWLGEVLLGAAWVHGGHPAIIHLGSFVLLATLLLMFSTSIRAGASVPASALAAGVSAITLWASPSRPVVFAWLMAAWLSFHLVGLARRQRTLVDTVFALLCLAAWANLHGSFVIGVAAVVCVVVTSELLRTSSSALEPVSRWSAVGLCIGAVLCTFVNPYGWHAWVPVWTVAQLETTRYWILEWKPTAPATAMGIPVVLVGACLIVLQWRRAASTRVICAGVAIIALGLLAVRNAVLSGILGCFIVARTIDDLQPKHPSTTRSPILPGLASLLALGIALTAVVLTPRKDHTDIERIRFPVSAAAFLDDHSLSGRLFNDPEHGGWWILRHPHRPVFIDGRADLHGDRQFEDYLRVIDARPGWRQTLRRIAPDILVIRSTAPLRSVLAMHPEYALVYESDGQSVFLSRSGANQASAERLQLSPPDLDPSLWNLKSIGK